MVRIVSGLSGLNVLECEVIAGLVGRLVLGRERYQPLTMERMRELTRAEQAEEVQDRLIYAEFEFLVGVADAD